MSIFSHCRLLLNEPTAAFWLDAQVYDALNNTQLDIYTRKPYLLTTSTTLSITQDLHLIPLPSNIMIPLYILSTNGKTYISTQHDLERENPTWLTRTTGYPSNFIRFGNTHLRPYPRALTTYSFTIHGVPWPTEFSDSSLDISGISQYLKDTIALQGAASLLSYTRPDLHDLYTQEALEAYENYKRSLKNQGGNYIHRLRPATSPHVPYRGTISIGTSRA